MPLRKYFVFNAIILELNGLGQDTKPYRSSVKTGLKVPTSGEGSSLSAPRNREKKQAALDEFIVEEFALVTK